MATRELIYKYNLINELKPNRKKKSRKSAKERDSSQDLYPASTGNDRLMIILGSAQAEQPSTMGATFTRNVANIKKQEN